MDRHQSDRVNSAVLFACLLEQAKTVFGLLTSVRIGPPSGEANGQTGAGELGPGRLREKTG